MERTLSLLLLSFLLFATLSCSDDNEMQVTDPYESHSGNINGIEVVNLRSAGKEIPNMSIDPTVLKEPNAEKSLLSLRYVEPLPIYFMDYYVDAAPDFLVNSTTKRYALYDIGTFLTDYDNYLYNNTPIACHQPINPSTTYTRCRQRACSGFYCYSPEGDLLFCRNYDGDINPLLILFNKGVKPGEHKSVMMTELAYCQSLFGLYSEYAYDSCLLEHGKNVEVLLRQPIAIMDGMNDAGFCIAAYQLPDFQNDDNPITEYDANRTPRPYGINQNTGKPQTNLCILHASLLAKCTTVEEAVDYLKSHNYVTLIDQTNVHWLVADATGDCKTLEYWKGNDGRDSLFVMDEEYRLKGLYYAICNVPYETRSIENYYCNHEAQKSYFYDWWQHSYSTKTRVLNMMSHYTPVMTEIEALRCLQHGSYGMEEPGLVTDWSCVYNPKKRTILFTMRNNLSKAYTIHLDKDL